MITPNNEPELYTGTPQSATPTSIVLNKNASNLNGVYTGFVLRIIEGAGLGEYQTIESYDGRTKIAAVYGTWTVIPDTTSVYVIINPEPSEFSASITLKVDPDLKTQFESLKEIHGMTVSDALEIGMKEVIRKVQPPQDIYHRIDELELEIRKLNATYGCALGGQAESENNKTDFRWDREQDGTDEPDQDGFGDTYDVVIKPVDLAGVGVGSRLDEVNV